MYSFIGYALISCKPIDLPSHSKWTISITLGDFFFDGVDGADLTGVDGAETVEAEATASVELISLRLLDIFG